MNRSAVISACGTYRYRLDRSWHFPLAFQQPRSAVLFVMLNPSTADAEVDDPTIRRCVDFAKRWGHDRLIVCNVFAFRATDPRELAKHAEAGGARGPLNHRYLHDAAAEASRVVVAWGASGTRLMYWRYAQRATQEALEPAALHSIGAPTKDGHPRHPLYLKAAERLQAWRGAT